MWRGLSRLLLGLGGLLVILGLGYGGLINYLTWQESSAPSTSRVLVLKDGRRIPLVQPTQPTLRSIPTATPPVALPGGVPDPAPALSPPPASIATPPGLSLAPAATQAYLPPLRITIPRIGVDWPVVLSVNEQLPRFKGVGWLMGSTYPGFTGNLVLFGHLDGRYATLGRLHELVPGDTFNVVTEDRTRVYRVRSALM